MAFLAEDGLVRDDGVRLDHAPVADDGAGADHGERTDVDVLPDRRGRVDDGARVDAGRADDRGLREERDGLREGEVGRFDAHERAARGRGRKVAVGADEDGGRLRRGELLGVLGVREERDVAGEGVVEGRDAGDLGVGRGGALDAAADEGGEFGESHRYFASLAAGASGAFAAEPSAGASVAASRPKSALARSSRSAWSFSACSRLPPIAAMTSSVTSIASDA